MKHSFRRHMLIFTLFTAIALVSLVTFALLKLLEPKDTAVTLTPLHFPPDTTIRPAKGAYAYENKTNTFASQFKSDPSLPKSIAFENSAASISFFTPPAQSFGTLTNTAARSEGNTVTYPAIYPQVDLRYTVFADRLLEEFIVQDATTAAKLTKIEQRAATSVATYSLQPNGSVEFTKSNQVVFTLPPPVLYELGNKEQRSYGIKYDLHRSLNGELTIAKVLTPEGLSWLKDSARVYPIAIDLVIDNADTAANWVSSTPANLYVAQETTIKEEGTGSVKLHARSVYGTGTDGACTISSTVDINASSCVGRGNGDAVAFTSTVSTSAGSSSITVSSTPTGLAAGDEVLIADLQGTAGDNANVGKYETKYISSISTNTLNLEGTLTNAYNGTTQKIVVQRIPQYSSVTVNNGGTMVPTAWNGSTGGVVFFRSAGTVTVNSGGYISLNQRGFRGGTSGGNGAETITGYAAVGANGDNGIGGAPYTGEQGGAGGGTGTGGTGGATRGAAGATGGAGLGGGGAASNFTYWAAGGNGKQGGGGAGGTTYYVTGGAGGGGASAASLQNTQSSTLLVMGAGAFQGAGGAGTGGNGGGAGTGNGGGGGYGNGAAGALGTGTSSNGVAGNAGSNGGIGGGILVINAPTINNNQVGGLTANSGNGGTGGNGGSGTNGGGGGMGGSGGQGGLILLYGGTISLGTNGVYAKGGNGGNGGAGGSGTIGGGTAGTGATFSSGGETGGGGGGAPATSTNQLGGGGGGAGGKAGYFGAVQIGYTTSLTGTTSPSYGSLSAPTRSTGETSTLTTGATNLSTRMYLTFWVRSPRTGTFSRFQFGEAASNEQTYNITVNSADTWEQKTWDISGISGTARDAVTKWAFQITDDSQDSVLYFDNIEVNSIPNTPSLDSPTNAATDQSPTPALKTTATDSESDHLKYKIVLCDNVGMTLNCQTFDQTLNQTGWSGQNADGNTTYTSGTQATYTIQSALNLGQTYYWHSYAIDPTGSGLWSSTQGSPYSFTVTLAPTAPTGLLTQGLTNPTSVNTLTPYFSALHHDPDGDSANYYQIEVNTASDFSGTSLWDSTKTSMTTTADGARSPNLTYAGSALNMYGSTYFWRIRFWDTYGLMSPWSSAAQFTTGYKPYPPLLQVPANSVTVSFLTVSFSLTSRDYNSDYLRYKIILCENSAMTLNCQTFDQTSSQTGWSGQDADSGAAYASGTQATYTLSSPLTNSKRYYWRGFAIDPANTNLWTDAQIPQEFSTNATTTTGLNCRIQESANDTSLTVVWVDNLNTETGYEVQRSVDGSGFSLLQDLAANSTSYQDTTISDGHTYQYRVSAYTAGPTFLDWCNTATLNLTQGNIDFENVIFR